MAKHRGRLPFRTDRDDYPPRGGGNRPARTRIRCRSLPCRLHRRTRPRRLKGKWNEIGKFVWAWRAFAEAEGVQRAANPPSGYYAGVVGLSRLASLGRLVPTLSRAAVVGEGRLHPCRA